MWRCSRSATVPENDTFPSSGLTHSERSITAPVYSPTLLLPLPARSPPRNPAANANSVVLQRQRHRHRHEDLTGGGSAGVRVRRGGGDGDGGGGAMEASRRGRFYHHDGPGAASAVPVVDQADCTAQTCRSCVAVTLADAIALGCCPCAVVSLLGLAFVKAPLALARRCLRRLRRRRGELRHKKRVRDMDGPDAKAKCRRSCDAFAGRGHGAMEPLDDADAASNGAWWGLEADARGEAAAAMRAARASNSSSSASGRLDAEKVWMEMYRVGHWGFGRLSISVTPPPHGNGDGGRKDVDLRCES
ncbi:hypothetical protein BDA96_03G266600 [Sorghum bicolor]|uniref:Uncharacterized protein n=1 Tax=Sorghum bicolor TaxID=4558 RepID=A0A921REI7_SORBI|nr:hypothetical protein BDA96_03G266600 [Sorghum bicolor]